MSPLLCSISLFLAQIPNVAAPDVGTSPPDSTAAINDAVEAAKLAAEAAKLAAEAATKAAAAVVALEPGPPPAPKLPPPPPPTPPATTGSFGLGLIWLEGNSNALTFSLNAAAAHKFDHGFGLSGQATAAYGQSQAPGATTQSVTAYNMGSLIRADKTMASEVQIFAQGGASTDHVASLELRYFGEGGAGLIWLDEKAADYQKVLLRTDLGLRAQQDDNWQYYPPAASATTGSLPGIFFLGPRFGVVFLYALNKGVVFSEDTSLQENIDGAPRTQVSSLMKLTAALVAHVSFAATFLATYDSNLTNLGKVDTDTALTIGLEGSF